MYDGCAAYHVRSFPRPSPSVFAYWKRSKTGGVEGLGTRLVYSASQQESKSLKCHNKVMLFRHKNDVYHC